MLGRCSVIVEIAGVGCMTQGRDDGAFLSAVIQRFPIHRREKGMGFHTVHTTREVAEPVRGVYNTKAGDQVAGVRVEFLGEFEFAFADPMMMVECQ